MTTESEPKPDMYYSYDHDYGLELHNTAEQAKERAEETLAMYESVWRAEDDVVEWGRLLPLGRARQVGDGDCELEDQPDELAQLRAERDSAVARAAAAKTDHGTIFADFSGGPGSDQDLQALADEVRTHGLHRLHPLLRSLVERVQAPLVQLVDDLKVERDRLKEHAKQVSFAAGLFELRDPEVGPFVQAAPEAVLESVKHLFSRVAELEAPPVVPDGFMVLKVPHEVDHQEYVDRWELWQLDGNEPPFVLAFVRSGDVWCDSYVLENRAAVRAFLWAIEHDQLPPHADKKAQT